MNKEPDREEAFKVLAESYGYMVKYAHDIAYARRSLYLAYIDEGFAPHEALELCKTI